MTRTFKRGQAFSVDFLIAMAVLTLVLGLWLNSFSLIEKNAFQTTGNATSFAIASVYFQNVSSGVLPAECSPPASGVISCDACTGIGDKIFARRLAVYQGQGVLLKVGVCV